MYFSIKSFSLTGLEARPVDIEVDAGKGLPAFILVGMPDVSLKESRERVISAIKNAGFKFPPKKIIVNLSPADFKKEGSSYDLPIALGFLVATGQTAMLDVRDTIVIGELALDGKVRGIKGMLPVAIAAREKGIKRIIIPASNYAEAALVENIDIIPVKTLQEMLDFLYTGKRAEMPEKEQTSSPLSYETDFSEIKGQFFARRAMEVAASGGHNILMIGPPGSGKTMLARRLPTVLPEMSFAEALETTKLYSISGKLNHISGLVSTRPFRAPHHTISDAAMIGGGSYPRPGEISLAHNGVLFLDEFAEFRKNVMEALRQPLEDGSVTVSRARDSITYPAVFMLVASMNPCPCGYFGDSARECSCSPLAIRKYFSRISGPILDRIDIQIELKALKYGELSNTAPGENSGTVRERVFKTVDVQKKRYEKETGLFFNSRMTPKLMKKYCRLSSSAEDILKNAIEKLSLSARAHDRILKVSRTIADMAGADNIEHNHIAEAVQYRNLDRVI